MATKETLTFLWSNYGILLSQVDLEHMSPEMHDQLREHNTKVRPYRISAWCAHVGAYVSIWFFWEQFARELVSGLPVTVSKKAQNESFVDFIGRALVANGKPFSEQKWFGGGNALRNLIAHYGGRVDDDKSNKLLDRARLDVGPLPLWGDNYVKVDHGIVAELVLKVEEFVDELS